MKRLKQKRPVLAADGDWLFHWDNCPVHKSHRVKEDMDQRGFKVIEHPPYSPDLAPADFFLFPKVKSALAGDTLTAGGLKSAWDGVTGTLTAADYAGAFQKWIE